jgi:hypothetical protein
MIGEGTVTVIQELRLYRTRLQQAEHERDLAEAALHKAMENLMDLVEAHHSLAHAYVREVELLRGAMRAQDERQRLAGEKCGVPYAEHGCDWPDAVSDLLIETRQAQLEQARLISGYIDANQDLRETLEQIQWGNEGFDFSFNMPFGMCPLCRQAEKMGHSPDCLVGNLLRNKSREPERSNG